MLLRLASVYVGRQNITDVQVGWLFEQSTVSQRTEGDSLEPPFSQKHPANCKRQLRIVVGIPSLLPQVESEKPDAAIVQNMHPASTWISRPARIAIIPDRSFCGAALAHDANQIARFKLH